MSRKPKTGITPEVFTQLYMESWKAGHTVRQFASRIGMTPVAAHARLRHYRKRGVAFPDLVPGMRGRPVTKPVPVKEMNSLISRAMEYRPQIPDVVRSAVNGRAVGAIS